MQVMKLFSWHTYFLINQFSISMQRLSLTYYNKVLSQDNINSYKVSVDITLDLYTTNILVACPGILLDNLWFTNICCHLRQDCSK